jgi:probable F420-dependent oxidoreductase
MTDPSVHKPDLGRYGVWTPGPVRPEQAVEIERLGYRAVWVGGAAQPQRVPSAWWPKSAGADLSFVEPILAQTESLTIATGIVNIWSAAAKPVADSYHRIEKAYPGRFLLGIGVGHPERIDEYRKPYNALVEYLDELDGYAVPTSRRVLAALGDKVLRLAAQRSAGAHPFLTTPEHTAHARAVVGNKVFLAPEHKVVLSTDVDAARAVGRNTFGSHLGLSNYVNNWKRLGFAGADVAKPGSDRLIDAVVAYGTADDVAKRVAEHLGAGADHVAIHVLGGWDKLLPTLTKLAGALGLTPRA